MNKDLIFDRLSLISCKNALYIVKKWSLNCFKHLVFQEEMRITYADQVCVLFILPSEKKVGRKKGRKNVMKFRRRGCAMSHPLNFPQFRRFWSWIRYALLCSCYKPQVFRIVYIIAGYNVIFRRIKEESASATRKVKICVIKDFSW